ncbi:MAG: hypothetical protein M5R41_18990 [Bacteroidia bacterium]|nr:hypothetical protein [Bacteroidia bacterium]
MRYRELFTIELLHDYFADGAARRIAIVPDRATRTVLAGCGTLAKQSGNRLFVIARTDDGTSPRVAPAAGSALTFFLHAEDASLFSLSQLRFNAAAGERFLFSNRDAGVVDGRLYLQPRNELFDNTKAYSLGRFVRDGAGDCHEALADLAPGSSLNNAQQWRKLGQLAYADDAQRVRVAGDTMVLPVDPPSDVVSVRVLGFNAANGQYDIEKRAEVFPYSVPVASQSVSLAALPDELFRVTVNDTGHTLYHRSAADWQQAFGIVRVYIDGGEAATHRVLHADGSFLSPVFAIRIAPASVLWQYNARTDRVRRVFDASATIEFSPVEARVFRSTLPQRLREQAYTGITVEYNDSNPLDPAKKIDIPLASVPGPGNSALVEQSGTTYVVNHVILNY